MIIDVEGEVRLRAYGNVTKLKSCRTDIELRGRIRRTRKWYANRTHACIDGSDASEHVLEVSR